MENISKMRLKYFIYYYLINQNKDYYSRIDTNEYPKCFFIQFCLAIVVLPDEQYCSFGL